MKKFSNKGFVLAETIIVAVFMVTIFSALYTNYFPLMANYEKREYYDDLDSKYIAFWLKYMIQDSSFLTSALGASFTSSFFSAAITGFLIVAIGFKAASLNLSSAISPSLSLGHKELCALANFILRF